MSRKIDAMVAEKVFGWKWIEFISHDYDGIAHKIRVLAEPGMTVDDVCKRLPPKGGVSETAFVNSRCSTDPAAMMVVKARLLEIDREKHGGMTGLYSTWDPYDCYWKVKIDWSDNTRYEAEHKDECVAWCLLGLAVCGLNEAEISNLKSQTSKADRPAEGGEP